jgi:hypothetical protein
MREYALSHKELTAKLRKIEIKYNKKFRDVFQAINFLLAKEVGERKQRSRRRIGFKP